MRPTALARHVSATFADALSATPPPEPIELARAHAQHAAYRAALRVIGLDVIELAAIDPCPDGCFIEDTAVVAAGLALVTRPGAPSRRAEVDTVATALQGLVEVARMEAPATLDGGDCLRLGRTLYVGRSARTNEAGIARLTEVFAPRGVSVVPVLLPAGVLHLKCVCSPLGDDRVLLARGSLQADTFGGAAVVWVPPEETYAANAVAHEGHAIIADGFPRTREALERAGFHTHPLPTTEGRKADGSLTCLSIVLAGSALG